MASRPDLACPLLVLRFPRWEARARASLARFDFAPRMAVPLVSAGLLQAALDAQRGGAVLVLCDGRLVVASADARALLARLHYSDQPLEVSLPRALCELSERAASGREVSDCNLCDAKGKCIIRAKGAAYADVAPARVFVIITLELPPEEKQHWDLVIDEAVRFPAPRATHHRLAAMAPHPHPVVAHEPHHRRVARGEAGLPVPRAERRRRAHAWLPRCSAGGWQDDARAGLVARRCERLVP